MPIDLAACARGEKAAWDAFVDRFTPVILAAVARTLGARGGADEERVRDTVQEVFVRLVRDDFRLLKAYDPDRASLSTWLTLVARSRALDELRRTRCEPRPVEEDVEHLAAPEPAPPGEMPAIPDGLLPPRQRLVLQLLFDEQKDVLEVAALLGVSPQTVRSAKHKALSRLRAHFGVGR